eukprot:g8150.t1
MTAKPDIQSLIGLREQLTQIPRLNKKTKVIKEPPRVCPAPVRNNECAEVSEKKSGSRRVKNLTRPTVSSLAKTRMKASNLNTTNTSCKKAYLSTKTTKKNSSRSEKHRDQSMIPTTQLTPNKKLWLCPKIFDDLISDTSSERDVSDRIEVNPLLIDADDFMFQSFSEEVESPCSSISESSCMDIELCETQHRSSAFASCFDLSSSCAFSFAAGFGVGMALGSCGLFTGPQFA